MDGSPGTALVAVEVNHRVRTRLVAGMLGAWLVVGIAAGVVLPREGSGPGVSRSVSVAPMLDAWRLAMPAVQARPAVSSPMLDAWRLGVAAVPTSRALPVRMIDAWRLAAAAPAAPPVSTRTVYSWLLFQPGQAVPAPRTMLDSWRLDGR